MPRSGRLAFFAAALLVVGASYASAGSADLQFWVLFALVFGVLPALGRRFGRRDDEMAASRDRVPPFRVNLLALAFWIAWTALVLLAAPDLGLGPWFWYLVVLWPCLEIYAYLGERDLRRHGAETWRPFHLIRHTASVGLGGTPVFVVILAHSLPRSRRAEHWIAEPRVPLGA